MKSKDMNYIRSIIIIALCFGLAGCDKKQNTESAFVQEVKVTSPPIPTIVASSNAGDNVIIGNTDTTNDISSNTGKVTDSNISEDSIDNSKISDNITFTETSEIVYATTNVNVRSSCNTIEDNVIIILHKGDSIKRIGYQKEWSKVSLKNKVGYIKSEYLSLKEPATEDTITVTPIHTPTLAPEISATPDAAKVPVKSEEASTPSSTTEGTNSEQSKEESFVSKLDVTAELDQLICVIGNGGADCTVSFHIKDNNGKWVQKFSTDGDCGSKGITYNKKEGDSKTPAGLYSFTMAFGIKSDPGALLPYRQITKYDYWIDDINSPYYNTWVNAQEIPGDYQSEHLIDHAPQYNYAMNINYNSNNTPGLGSAIFLHGYNGAGKTSGCIAMAESYVKELIRSVDASTKILIVPDRDDLSKY